MKKPKAKSIRWSSPRLKGFPKVGDDVYVRTSLYIGHGLDDFQGGLCEIISLKIEDRGISYSVKERPGTTYFAYSVDEFWEEQAEMKKTYGKSRGYPDPDTVDYGG